jgi:two-component system, OmpR family, sensor kinase
MAFIAFLYFQNEKTLYFDLTKSNMQNITSQISSKIVFSHMTNTPLDTKDLLKSTEYKIFFYNEKRRKREIKYIYKRYDT